MNVPFEVKKLINPSLVEPSVIEALDDNGNPKFYSLQKEAIRYLYRNLAMSYSSSKILFKADKTSWKNYIIQQSTREELEKVFTIDNKYFVIIGSMIVAIVEKDITEKVNEFFNGINSTFLKMDNNSIVYAEEVTVRDDNKIYFEFDFINGIYKIAYGMKLDDIYVLTSPCVYIRNIEDLVNYNIEYEYNLLTNIVLTLGFKVSTDDLRNTKLSIREILEIARICKIKFYVDKVGLVDPVQCSNEDMVNTIAEKLRLTGIPLKSLKHMKYLEKSMKITDITVYDIVKIYIDSFTKPNCYYSLDLMNYIFYNVYYSCGDYKSLKA